MRLLFFRLIFQSTLPAWGATLVTFGIGFVVDISIHAPRVGSDNEATLKEVKITDISIHAPRVGSDCPA